MSTFEKLKARLRRKPVDFTFKELQLLLSGIGYKEDQGGHSSGSRVTFFQSQLNHVIKIHKPHPGNNLKRYQVKQIVETLTNQKLL